MRTNINTPLIELDLLKSLVAITDTGNFSAAAERVGRTPSAISMQVKKLEAIIGHKVFERGPRSVRLTPAGEKLLAHGRRLLAENRQMMAQFAEPDLVGDVRLGIYDDVAEKYLPMILKNFHEHWPGISILITIENSLELSERIGKGLLDLAIVSTSGKSYQGLNVEELMQDEIVWAGLAAGCAAQQRPLPISVWDCGCVFNSLATRALELAEIDYVKSVISATTTGQKLAIKADFTIAPLARSSLDDQIVDVGPQSGLPPIGECTVGMAFADQPLSPPISALIDFLRTSFGGS